jgi:hypothetical protein
VDRPHVLGLRFREAHALCRGIEERRGIYRRFGAYISGERLVCRQFTFSSW